MNKKNNQKRSRHIHHCYNDYLEKKALNNDPNTILKYIKYCKLFSIIPNKGSFKLANIHINIHLIPLLVNSKNLFTEITLLAPKNLI